jgi:type II secretory pathway predicted ATPase ExeA
MYEQFFGFQARPFALTPDPRFLLLTSRHAAALTMLEYGLASDAGISVLTGEVGCGKTTLTRHVLGRLGPDRIAGNLNHTHRGSGRLLHWAALALGLEATAGGPTALYRTFHRFLAEQRAQSRRVLLVVDEAQNLGAARLEELRVLSNLNDGGGAVLQLLLVGQPELHATLGRPKLRQLAQRVAVECNLGGLTRDETHEYVRHRVSVAGGRPDLFSVGAVDLAHLHAGGIPRLVNQLCDRALVYAFADQRTEVDGAVMEQVVRDRLSGGIFPAQQSTTGRRRRRLASAG